MTSRLSSCVLFNDLPDLACRLEKGDGIFFCWRDVANCRMEDVIRVVTTRNCDTQRMIVPSALPRSAKAMGILRKRSDHEPVAIRANDFLEMHRLPACTAPHGCGSDLYDHRSRRPRRLRERRTRDQRKRPGYGVRRNPARRQFTFSLQ